MIYIQINVYYVNKIIIQIIINKKRYVLKIHLESEDVLNIQIKIHVYNVNQINIFLIINVKI